jgi:hypothetical protein
MDTVVCSVCTRGQLCRQRRLRNSTAKLTCHHMCFTAGCCCECQWTWNTILVPTISDCVSLYLRVGALLAYETPRMGLLVCRSQSHVCVHTSTDLQRSYCCFNDHIEDEHMYTD